MLRRALSRVNYCWRVGHELTLQQVQRPLPVQHMRKGTYPPYCIHFLVLKYLRNAMSSKTIGCDATCHNRSMFYIFKIRAYDNSGTSAAYTRTVNLDLLPMAVHLPNGVHSRMGTLKAHTQTTTQVQRHLAMVTTIPHRWHQQEEGLQSPTVPLERVKRGVWIC